MSRSVKEGTNLRGTLGALAGAVIIVVVPIAVWFSTAAFAQNDALVKAGLTVWRNSGCSDCHGAFANGVGGRDKPGHDGAGKCST
jgi:hypothetical protein